MIDFISSFKSLNIIKKFNSDKVIFPKATHRKSFCNQPTMDPFFSRSGAKPCLSSGISLHIARLRDASSYSPRKVILTSQQLFQFQRYKRWIFGTRLPLSPSGSRRYPLSYELSGIRSNYCEGRRFAHLTAPVLGIKREPRRKVDQTLLAHF